MTSAKGWRSGRALVCVTPGLGLGGGGFVATGSAAIGAPGSDRAPAPRRRLFLLRRVALPLGVRVRSVVLQGWTGSFWTRGAFDRSLSSLAGGNEPSALPSARPEEEEKKIQSRGGMWKKAWKGRDGRMEGAPSSQPDRPDAHDDPGPTLPRCVDTVRLGGTELIGALLGLPSCRPADRQTDRQGGSDGGKKDLARPK